MDASMGALVGMAAVAAVCLVAGGLYRWRQRGRARRVGEAVRAFLCERYGEVPYPLHINCSDDRLWPVLVDFSNPGTGIQHRLRFDCPGSGSVVALLQEEWEMHSEVRETDVRPAA
jgi:hypothetical protein